MPPAKPYPVCAILKFGDGRMNEVRFATYLLVGTAGGRGKFTAFLMDADTPALLRSGALEPSGGHLGSPRNISTLGSLNIDVPLKVNGMGHHVLSVAPSGSEW